MSERAVLDWLLEETEPSIRYATLGDLLGKGPNDPERRAARAGIPDRGFAPMVLSKAAPDGFWGSSERLYEPKYLSTNWMLLLLADLGMSREDPRIAPVAEAWMDRFATRDGSFAPNGGKTGHLCTAGNTARALIQFGYADAPPVQRALDWLVRSQSHLGGWSCWGSGRNLDSWEALSSFAAYPKARWTPPMKNAVERGVEFFLSRELERQGDRYEPWYRFHDPVHYYYDLLVGLDLVTGLGFSQDRRLASALAHLRKRRRRDGRWNLDAVHPDVEGGMAEWFAKNPKKRPTPFALETVGRPSKRITVRALRVLARVDGTA